MTRDELIEILQCVGSKKDKIKIFSSYWGCAVDVGSVVTNDDGHILLLLDED